jgi:hypothetical protein
LSLARTLAPTAAPTTAPTAAPTVKHVCSIPAAWRGVACSVCAACCQVLRTV